MGEHATNHHGGWIWPRGQASWCAFAAEVGSAWIADVAWTEPVKG